MFDLLESIFDLSFGLIEILFSLKMVLSMFNIFSIIEKLELMII